ncbi:MAG TPA: hypothetical protein VEU30_13380 [Thermoanaerobaculia bacterium]|nr:hypothetical protein [Thermoanaerobaculia bacterium]
MLATFALALLAGTAVAASVENIIIRDGNQSFVYGDGDYRNTSFGDRYASFELDGVRYVITDEATLEELNEILEPQVELGKKQADLGAKQAKLGEEQARLGAKQAELGARQAWARDDEQRELSGKQRELSAKQRELGDRQRVLGDRQRELGDAQREAGREAKKELEKVFRNAVRSGVARRR